MVGPPCTQFLCILGSVSSGFNNHVSHTAIVFTIGKKKNPCLSGPAWFKPVLFKSQLYVYLGQMLASTARRSFYFKWTTSLMRKSVPLYF